MTLRKYRNKPIVLTDVIFYKRYKIKLQEVYTPPKLKGYLQ